LPPRAATTCHDLITGGGQIFENVAGHGVDDQCAGRNLDRQVGAVASMAIRAAASAAVFSIPMFLHRECREAVHARGGDDHHAPPVAPIAAIGTAARNVFLAAKAAAPVAAAACFQLNRDPIDEHKLPRRLWTAGMARCQSTRWQ
jgi:hypothetical protein